MGWSTIFKYWGFAMEAAEQAADVYQEVQKAKDPNSPGGREITDEEKATLIENLDDNFSQVVTRICEEFDLPIEEVQVIIKMK